VVLQNMVCDHNYTTLANEQGPGPCSSVSPLHFGSGWLAVWLRGYTLAGCLRPRSWSGHPHVCHVPPPPPPDAGQTCIGGTWQ
jgi:hypothetical protein